MKLDRALLAAFLFATATALTPTLGHAKDSFRPFAPVTNVCSSCPMPVSDVVTLAGGEVVHAWVVGENAEFYVLVRLGEARAVPRKLVERVEKSDKLPASDRAALEGKHRDQILISNGHVISGRIIQRGDDGYTLETDKGFQISVVKKLAAVVVENGKVTHKGR